MHLSVAFIHTLPVVYICTHLTITYRVIQNDCQGFNNLPPRSPDATACDLFLWGYVKDQVYVPPLPATEGNYQNRH